MKRIDQRANFSIIRYSNCWEDADILIEAFSYLSKKKLWAKGKNYLSILSAGDNSLSLLIGEPDLVMGVDLNLSQIAIAEIKKIIFIHLDYEDILKFLGIKKEVYAFRRRLYYNMRKYLSSDSKNFWNDNIKIIEKGLIHAGKFERYFALFRKYILPFVINSKGIKQLLEKKKEVERVKFYNQRINTRRWRLLFNFFFSRRVMGIAGRDPEFFKYVKGSVAENILKRAEYAVTVLPTDNNPYLEYILTGNYTKILPHYLRKENFETIKKNAERLFFIRAAASEAVFLSGIRFSGMNLSDIFEYMTLEEYQKELGSLIEHSDDSAIFVYWNMLVNRNASIIKEKRVERLELSRELFLRDKAFFYKDFIIEKKRTF